MADNQNRWFNYGLVIGIVALIGLAIYGIYSQFEKITTTINAGYSIEAAKNPYLAAQQYLDLHKVNTESAIDLSGTWDQLNEQDAILLLNTRVIPEAYHANLLGWVERGGHLVITAQNFWDEEYQESGDIFLDHLGVRMYSVFEEDDEESEAEADSSVITEDEINQAVDEALSEILPESNLSDDESNEENATEGNQCLAYNYNRLSLIDYSDNKPAIQVQFSSYGHLEDNSGNALGRGDYYPNNILQYEIGQGLVTTITANHMWENSNISWYDHAFFLWLLVGDAEKVWFIFDTTSESLFALLTQYLLEPVVAGLLLLACYLWYRAKRFGPIAQAPAQARRSLLEHLQANARFNWRHQQIAPLIQKQRDDIKHYFSLRHGEHQSQQFMVTQLAHASQLSDAQVEWAMTTVTPEREQEFVKLIQLLQRLRNAV